MVLIGTVVMALLFTVVVVSMIPFAVMMPLRCSECATFATAISP